MSLISVSIIHLIIIILFLILIIYAFFKYTKNIFISLLILFLIYFIYFYNEILYTCKITYHASCALYTGEYKYFEDLSSDTIYHINKNLDIKLQLNSCKDIYIKEIKDYKNFYKTPVIFVSNYVGDSLEYFNFGLMGDVTLVARSFHQTRYGFLIENLFTKDNFIPVELDKSNYDNLKTNIQKHIKNKSIYVYPEEPEGRGGYKIVNFKTGIFKIAKELNIPIVPIVWDHFDTDNYSIKPKNYKVTFGKIYHPYKYHHWEEFLIDIKKWMSETLESYNL